MIEIAAPEGSEQEIPIGAPRQLPATVPVLPLREAVPLPDTLIPLAVGQERSVRLVDYLWGNGPSGDCVVERLT